MLAVLVAVAVAYLLLGGAAFAVFLLDPYLARLAMLVLVALACGGWLGSRQRGGPVAWWGLLTLAAAAVAAAASVYPRGSWEAVLWQGLNVGVLFLGVAVAGDEAGRRTLLLGLLAATGLLVAGAVWEAIRTAPGQAIYLTEFGQVRVSGSLNHPNNLAGFLAMMVPVGAGLMLAEARAGRRLAWLLAAVLALALYVAAKTYSKGGQLALVGGCLVCALALPRGGWLTWWRGDRKRAVVVLAAAGLVLTAGGLAFWHSEAGDRLRLFVELLPKLRQFERWGTWSAAVRMAAADPLTGVGPACFGLMTPAWRLPGSHYVLYTHAHNWYLNVLAEQGLPGLVALLGLLAAALATGRRGLASGERPVRAGVLGGLAGFALAGILDVNVGVPAVAVVFHLMVGLTAADRAGGPPPALRRAGGALTVVLALVWFVWSAGQLAYTRAYAHLTRGEVVAAASWLEQARRLDPRQRAYQLLRVDLALVAGNQEAALADLSALDRQSPPLSAHYRSRLAWLLWRHDRRDEAEAVLAAAQTADPAEPVLAVDAAVLALRRGELGRAEELARRALAADPACAGAVAVLAEVLDRDGDPIVAARLLEGGAFIAEPRDRLPRFLIAYGRVDPFPNLPAERRWLLPDDRLRYDGQLLPRLRLRALALAETGRLRTAPATPGG